MDVQSIADSMEREVALLRLRFKLGGQRACFPSPSFLVSRASNSATLWISRHSVRQMGVQIQVRGTLIQVTGTQIQVTGTTAIN